MIKIDAIKRGVFGTLVCWPMLELLSWAGINHPLAVAVILTIWMTFWWWFYGWVGRTFQWPRFGSLAPTRKPSQDYSARKESPVRRAEREEGL